MTPARGPTNVFGDIDLRSADAHAQKHAARAVARRTEEDRIVASLLRLSQSMSAVDAKSVLEAIDIIGARREDLTKASADYREMAAVIGDLGTRDYSKLPYWVIP